MDGIVTQKSALEHESIRGRLISHAKIAKKFGGIVMLLMLAALNNRIEYGGSFCNFGLSFNRLTVIFIVIMGTALVYGWLWTNEKDMDDKIEKVEIKRKLGDLWDLLNTSYYLKFILFVMIQASVRSIKVC